MWTYEEAYPACYFSEFKEVTNAAAPGTLLRTTTYEAWVTDIIAYNPAGVDAVITFYDEDSKKYTEFKVGADETAVIELKSALIYHNKSVYARTDQAVNACITIAGKEIQG